MGRILVLAPEPIRDLMAGMGIRAAEIARHLSLADHPVTLVTPGDPAAAPAWLGEAGVRVVSFESSSLARLAANHDGAIVSGHIANDFFHLAPPIPTLVDLYDPFLIENLTYARRLGWEPFRNDHRTLALQLARGDRFLVSSREQRLFYSGCLLSLGRVNPAALENDPALEKFLPIVPFGTPDNPPERGAPLLRGVVPGIGPSDPILFFGGIYDWYDPDELLAAYGHVLAEVPDCRLVFVRNPNPDSTPQEACSRAEKMAREKGWLQKNVFFIPWFSYERRGSLYLESTAAVLTHQPGLETELSLRTRGLDFLWAGLPIVSHRGGAMGSLLADHGAGILVDLGDRAGLAGALVRVLTDRGLRKTLSDRSRELAGTFHWKNVLAPVFEFAIHPEVDRSKESFRPEPFPGAPAVGRDEGAPGFSRQSFSRRLTTRLEKIFRGEN